MAWFCVATCDLGLVLRCDWLEHEWACEVAFLSLAMSYILNRDRIANEVGLRPGVAIRVVIFWN